MTTTHEVYWVVTVTETGDAETGLSSHTRKFRFRGPDALHQAANCYANAVRHGLKARAEQVRAYRGETVRV